MRKIIWLALILVLGMIAGCDRSGSERAFKSKIGVGSPAPDFMLRNMKENNISLSGYKGKVVLITFWNMKCKDCTESMESLEALNRRFGDRGLTVIAVNADNLEYVKPEKIINFIKSRGYTFNVLFDETFSVSESFKVVAIPMTFLIDRGGSVSFMEFGRVDWTSPEKIEVVQNLLN